MFKLYEPNYASVEEEDQSFCGLYNHELLPDASTSICGLLFDFTCYKNIYLSRQFIESQDLLHWKHFGIHPIPTRCEMAEA